MAFDFLKGISRRVHAKSAPRQWSSEAMPDAVNVNILKNYVTWNDRYHWSADGDEWTGQAARCGIPYEAWKESLIERMIRPHVGQTRNVIEIAPGHGRWSEVLVPNSAFCTLVDLSSECLVKCRKRFASHSNVEYFLTTGTALPRYCTGQIDFVWSYDSFVHMAPEIVADYLGEIARVLRPGGLAILHHANISELSSHDQDKHPGWRSAVNNSVVQRFAARSSLIVERQFMYWDEDRKIGVPNFGDSLTVLRRPG